MTSRLDLSGLEDAIVSLLRDWATRHPEIVRLWLFGSRAKGKARPDSDVDLAVQVVGSTQGEALATAICSARRWERELTDLTGLQIDLDAAFPDDSVVMPAVIEHGICLYDSGARAWGD